jgi:hypothetical protein
MTCDKFPKSGVLQCEKLQNTALGDYPCVQKRVNDQEINFASNEIGTAESATETGQADLVVAAIS